MGISKKLKIFNYFFSDKPKRITRRRNTTIDARPVEFNNDDDDNEIPSKKIDEKLPGNRIIQRRDSLCEVTKESSTYFLDEFRNDKKKSFILINSQAPVYRLIQMKRVKNQSNRNQVQKVQKPMQNKVKRHQMRHLWQIYQNVRLFWKRSMCQKRCSA